MHEITQAHKIIQFILRYHLHRFVNLRLHSNKVADSLIKEKTELVYFFVYLVSSLSHYNANLLVGCHTALWMKSGVRPRLQKFKHPQHWFSIIH